MERLARELKIWASLQHPNILKLQGFYLSEDYEVATLISVHMVNGNVSLYIAQKQPDMATRLKFVQGITAGVNYLHDLDPPIAHGDLKPANVLISDNIDAILCDFGLASLISDESAPSGLSTTGPLKGTPRYMSPELLLENESKHTLPSDIWAWACTVYEILTDIEPFNEANVAAKVIVEASQKRMPGSREVLSDRLPQNETWSNKLSESIIDCWKFEPEKRPSVATLICTCDCLSKDVASSPSEDLPGPGNETERDLLAFAGPSDVDLDIASLRLPVGVQQLLNLLTRESLVVNRTTAILLENCNLGAGVVQHMRTQKTSRPKRKILVISVSAYTNGWRVLHGPKTDWKLWAVLGMVSGWNVEIVADSLPNSDPARYPTRKNIERFAKAHLKKNGEGDQFVLVYLGYCDDQGLVLADGSHISPQELRRWLLKPLKSGSFLWYCESSGLLGLRYKIFFDKNLGIVYQYSEQDAGCEVYGTVVSTGTNRCAGPSEEMDLNDPKAQPPDQPLYCGPLTWAAYSFFCTACKEGEPLLARFLPVLKEVLVPRPGQVAQITTSSVLPGPTLPVLRALPSGLLPPA